jgi:hypothetical protein
MFVANGFGRASSHLSNKRIAFVPATRIAASAVADFVPLLGTIVCGKISPRKIALR